MLVHFIWFKGDNSTSTGNANKGLISKISKTKANALKLLGEGTRYDITDEDLKQFIKDCWFELFAGVHLRMMFTWKFFRNPSKEEKKWYEIFWGPKRANIFFSDYNKKLRSLGKSGKKKHHEAKKEVMIYINGYDEKIPKDDKSSIPKVYKRICDRYHNVIEKYPYPSTMLLELVYPQFLREIHETKNT